MARPWMPLYVGDYLGDTRHLTLEQHGAYLLLIMHYWATGNLPNDDAALRQILGLHGVNGANRWRSICLAIAPFFEDGWNHKRIEAELEKANIIKAKRQMAGFKGGKVSRGRTNMDRNANQAFAKQTGGIPHKYITTTEYDALCASKPTPSFDLERLKGIQGRKQAPSNDELVEFYPKKTGS